MAKLLIYLFRKFTSLMLIICKDFLIKPVILIITLPFKIPSMFSATLETKEVPKGETPKGKNLRHRLFLPILNFIVDRNFCKMVAKKVDLVSFDIIQIHDSYPLNTIKHLPKKLESKVIFDAVEIPENRSGWARRNGLLNHIERLSQKKLVKTRVDSVITVSNGLSNWIEKHYKVPKPFIIRNCRYYEQFPPNQAIRNDCKLGKNKKLVLYLNSLYSGQGLEYLVESVKYWPSDVHLATLGPEVEKQFCNFLRQKISKLNLTDRIHILSEKSPSQMIEYASGAHIGVIPRQNTCLNNYYSLPNRVFEMVMARLPIAGPTLIDMKDFIEEHQIGLTFDETSPKNIAHTILKLLEPKTYKKFKNRVEKAAKQLCWEKEGKRYVDYLQSVALEK